MSEAPTTPDDRPALPRTGEIPASVRRVMTDYWRRRLREIEERIQAEKEERMREHLAEGWSRISYLLGRGRMDPAP